MCSLCSPSEHQKDVEALNDRDMVYDSSGDDVREVKPKYNLNQEVYNVSGFKLKIKWILVNNGGVWYSGSANLPTSMAYLLHENSLYASKEDLKKRLKEEAVEKHLTEMKRIDDMVEKFK